MRSPRLNTGKIRGLCSRGVREGGSLRLSAKASKHQLVAYLFSLCRRTLGEAQGAERYGA
jgi:hypothetical protein